LQSSGILKSITGGDAIYAQHKHQKPFNFVAKAKLLFSANHLPRSRDNSKAFLDRFLIVPFEKTFPRNDAKGRELKVALCTDEELSGVLNKVLQVLPLIRVSGLDMPQSVGRAVVEFRDSLDPLARWLERETASDPSGTAPKQLLRAAFNHGQETEHVEKWTENRFGKRLRELRPEIGEAQRTVDGRPKVWVYTGIRLKDECGWNLVLSPTGSDLE
jgi:putative DNA primase/helicase